MCTYNAERFIDPTLKSIVNQTYDNIEVLILDNNSSDDTVEKISQYDDSRIQMYTKSENLGPYRGLNYLIKRANGKYIAIQDHDDIWHEQKIELQVDFLENHDQYVGCGAESIKLYENQNKIAISKDSNTGEDSGSVSHTTLMFRNDQYYYDTSIKYKTDLYFMEGILCDGEKKLYTLPDPLNISLVRADNQNLSFAWTSGLPLNVINYYQRTGNTKRLFWGLLISLLPVSVAQRVKVAIFDYETLPVTHLAESEFTATYLAYIESYLDDAEQLTLE